MPGGNQAGTLLHRLVCPALGVLREKFMPKWIHDYLSRNGGTLGGTMFLSFTRGLFPATKAPHRDPDLFDTFDWVDLICDAPAGWDPNVFDSFNWVRTKRDIPTGCVVFTDASLLDGLLPDGW